MLNDNKVFSFVNRHFIITQKYFDKKFNQFSKKQVEKINISIN